MTAEAPEGDFSPLREDIFAVRKILASFGLPTELVLSVLDSAHYWTEATQEVTNTLILFDDKWDLNFTAAYPYIRICTAIPPLTELNEVPKVREIEFLIVSHDQGWTTEVDVIGTYKTSSWFEVSIARPYTDCLALPGPATTIRNLEEARPLFEQQGLELLHRPSPPEWEPQRLHCPAMMQVTGREHSGDISAGSREGTYAWYLQGNKVARGRSVFDGEMIKRYRVIWGCATNLRKEGNEGSGLGEGFVDTLRYGDWIIVWARAKRRGWDNHVLGIRVTLRSTI